MKDFNYFMDDNMLLEFDRVGPKFSFTNKQGLLKFP